MVWKRSNALVHFHRGPQTADAFMHNFEWIYLSDGFEYHIFTFARRFCAFFCTRRYKKLHTVHKCVYAFLPLNRRYIVCRGSTTAVHQWLLEILTTCYSSNYCTLFFAQITWYAHHQQQQSLLQACRPTTRHTWTEPNLNYFNCVGIYTLQK